jgi:ferredoxin
MRQENNGEDRGIEIQINNQCISCGSCVEVCPMGVLSYESDTLQSKKPIITDPSVCIRCGQCIAVCPKDAITNNYLLPEGFPEVDSAPTVEWNQFIALTRQRRSIRNFSNKMVPRELIQKILDESTRYAPTGHNRQATEILIIEGESLKELRDEMNSLILRLNTYLKFTHWISDRLNLQWRQIRLWKRMIELGMDPTTRNAPLALLFITDNRVRESEIDASILSYQTLLSAEVLELQSCYFGALRNSLPYSRKLRKRLNLPPHRIVVCGLLLGYSKVKYRRLVSRKPLKIYAY